MSKGELYVHNRPISYKFKEVLVETYWFQRHCEVLPMFRARHRKMPGNKVFDFPEVRGFITHNDRLERSSSSYGPSQHNANYTWKQASFEFISKHTTTAPPSESTATPAPSSPPVKVTQGGNVIIDAASSVVNSVSVAKYLRVLIPFW